MSRITINTAMLPVTARPIIVPFWIGFDAPSVEVELEDGVIAVGANVTTMTLVNMLPC